MSRKPVTALWMQRVNTLPELVTDRVDDLELRTNREARRLLRRFNRSPLRKRRGAVRKQLRAGPDGALDRLVLMRKARHKDLLRRAKRRVTAVRKKVG